MEFTGVKFDYVEAKKEKDGPVSGLNININVDEVKAAGDVLLLEFTYTVNYSQDMGYIKIRGSAYFRDATEKVSEIEENWKETKKLPNEIIQPLLNVVNYSASVNGIFVARVLNLAPPIVPPKIELKGKSKAKN